MYPRAGGVYVYLAEAFGPLPGFLYGWTMLLVALCGGCAAVAVGFADYLSHFAPALGVDRILWAVPLGSIVWKVSAGQFVGVASLVFLGVINYIGVESGSATNAVLTAAKILGLAMLPIAAIIGGTAHPVWTPVVPPTVAAPGVAFGVAMIAVLWANDGYYFLTYAAGEVRDAKRNLPRALIYGLLGVLAIYLTVNLAYLFALPMDQLAGASRVAERAATATLGPGGGTIVALTVIVSTLGCNAAAILVSSRLLYAMAADGLFFKAAGAVHPRFRSPHVAVVIVTVWSAFLTLSGTYEQLFTYVVFTSVLFSLFGGLALFRLRRTRPDADRPYRVWGYPVVPALFMAGSVFVIYNTLKERPFESISGLALLLLGLPVYYYWKRSGARGT
jgi:APA family basic amino acid/polyamine antiporter